MSSSTPSALIGNPPATLDDFYIIRGMLRVYGLNNVNASLGYLYAIPKPADPPNESKQVGIIVGMVIVILAIVVPTLARVAVRLKANQTRFGSDDWATIIAATGAGRHTYENTYEQYNRYFYYLAVCKIIFYVSVGLIKVSITLFVRRLADRASKKWKVFADIFLATVVIYLLLAIFWTVFTCKPLGSAWDKKFAGSLDEPPGILLLAAPIIILWHVKIDLSKKARLFFIWLVGGTTVIGGLLQQTSVTITNDTFWQFTSVLRWTVLDLTLGTLTVSLPVLDAAIMGAWNTAKSKLGTSGSNSRSRTQGWTDIERSTTTVIPGKHGDDTESMENIIRGHGDGVELGIIRTDEVSLTYENGRRPRTGHYKA
ncbi:hypothetical protein G7Z17_g560 [Cylindrodendrum hubeiense]|uniref:Rhodopsin domain-containing protein n=1 Tax=Cylindrodendrum hubeiense TaxID=595255 RepID=A0A9P5HLC6_9HYPO|nr:hypothetical protein G7Z17_g560 [Cylindrodendrum hubeiense]